VDARKVDTEALPSIPNGTAPGIPIGQGETAVDIARRGGFGGQVGGGGRTYDHPAGAGGYRSTASDTKLSKNQQIAYDTLKKLGYSHEAARIALANLSGESLRDPSNVHRDPSRSNPNQMAHGIASWDDARAERIRQQFGKLPNEMSVEDQTKAFDWEMKNHYKSAYDTLTNEKLAADQRMYGIVKGCENPANPENDVSRRMAIFNGLKLGGDGQSIEPPKRQKK
jgi:hypothetical protein